MSVRLTSIRDLSKLEASCQTGVLTGWDSLPCSFPFVSRRWCMAWYRCYADLFEPLLLAAESGGELVGLAPLAIERATNRIQFAGEPFGDYREILAQPEVREQVITAIVDFYGSSGFQNPLKFAIPRQDADLTAILRRALRSRLSVHETSTLLWTQAEATSENSPFRHKVIRYNHNRLAKEVPLDLLRIRTPEAWRQWKDVFFNMHSLRQIEMRRVPSFLSPRKQAFFEALIHEELAHFTLLQSGDAVIAGHIGHFHNGSIYYGAPAFDIRYHKYSPGLLLLALLIKDAPQLGFHTLDLTPGDDWPKVAAGIRRQPVVAYTIHASRASVWKASTRAAAARMVRLIASEEQAEQIKASLNTASEKVRRDGFWAGVQTAARLALRRVVERISMVRLVAIEASVDRAATRAQDISIHRDNIEDLLRTDCIPEVSEAARAYAETALEGHRLHTLLVGGELAGWALSHVPTGPGFLPEAGGVTVDYPPASASLYRFYVLPKFRGRGLQRLLYEHILRERFAEGTTQAYCCIDRANAASMINAIRAGFKPVEEHRYLRILRWSWQSSRALADASNQTPWVQRFNQLAARSNARTRSEGLTTKAKANSK